MNTTIMTLLSSTAQLDLHLILGVDLTVVSYFSSTVVIDLRHPSMMTQLFIHAHM
jgi:hypothetical protein